MVAADKVEVTDLIEVMVDCFGASVVVGGKVPGAKVVSRMLLVMSAPSGTGLR
jgi:hypothetical protein